MVVFRQFFGDILAICSLTFRVYLYSSFYFIYLESLQLSYILISNTQVKKHSAVLNGLCTEIDGFTFTKEVPLLFLDEKIKEKLEDNLKRFTRCVLYLELKACNSQ